MKKYIIILTIQFILLNLVRVFAEDYHCGDHIDCPKIPRPYLFCDGKGNIVSLCAIDPFNFDGGDWYNGFSNVLKLNNNAIPLCLEFDNSGPASIRSDICGGGECHIGLIYLKSDFQNDMKEAEKKWKCVCGWNENDCGCIVKIGFVDKNHFEFSDPDNDYSSNSVWNQFYPNDKEHPNYDPNLLEEVQHIKDTGPVSGNSCEINCNNLHIYLNNTDAFTKRSSLEPDYYGGKFYVSGSVCENWDYNYWGEAVPGESKNLRNLITRELGKLYGMINNVVSDVGDCGSVAGIMDELEEPEKFEGLTLDDKCNFMSLYCPSLTPVEENMNTLQGKKMEVFPNPSENASIITLNSDKFYSNVQINLFDNLGRNIKSINNIEIKPGQNIININNNDLVSGIYTFSVILDNSIIQQRLIIMK